jgi:hypothetical protein
VTLYRTSDGRIVVPVRAEHRLTLRDLTLALYRSTEVLGAELTARRIRQAVAEELSYYGSELLTRVADDIAEAREYGDGAAFGSEVNLRLAWARRMVVKAYGAEYGGHPESDAALRAFEALAVGDLS